ncbi:MAG TPA: [FeFe] hydrogenase H-cluster radical SAM maturase HydE, partial [Acidobacteriota bacterium]|nr:[FeFe] hydrogenase H-cluster radical SAM maturase HydE [Acidobacteriota bacterium]
MSSIDKILNKDFLDREDLVLLLSADEHESKSIFHKAAEIKRAVVGNKVYFRGLIEYSNHCAKNCFYCGIRSGNSRFVRYEMTDDEVMSAARYAWENRFASIVIQSGERDDERFVSKIEKLLRDIHAMTGNELHVTLSLGEQSMTTYRRWREAGAHRYLLRIEVSSPELYRKLHPDDHRHSYEERLEALCTLREAGYQIGTGVMIGLPFQTIGHLADDLIFFRDFDIDMAGMGPYIEHRDTPMYQYRHDLMPLSERFALSLKMIALLRIIMKDINIAAATALQAIDPVGREKALQAGANVIMPNLTPTKYRENYLLYENKPCLDEDSRKCKQCLETRISLS